MSSTAPTPKKLAALILPVCIAGLGVLVAAAYEFGTTSHSGRELVGLAALMAAATLAERFPVPISPEGGGARRAAACDLALPTVDAPRAPRDAPRIDRPADRSWQPSSFPRALAARVADRRRGWHSAHALLRRHRRLQDDQRPLRSSGRR